MRFAVHRQASAVASPRFHGVPRRDVACRVHVGVAGVAAGSAPEARLALARPPVHVPARRAPSARVGGWHPLDPARGLVLHQQTAAPSPTGRSRFSPVLARTLRPGCSAVPFATGSWSRCSGPRRGSRRSGGRCRWTSSLPVLAPVRLAGLQPSDRRPGPGAPGRSARGPGEPALQAEHPRLLARDQAGRR